MSLFHGAQAVSDCDSVDMEIVPVIDISCWINFEQSSIDSLTQEHSRSIEKWDKAMRAIGCVIVTGHGISEEVFGQLNAECADFFHSPLVEKMKYNHGAYGHPKGGYTAPGNEIVALSCEEEVTLDSKINAESSSAHTASTAVSGPSSVRPAKKDGKFDPVENFVFTSRPKDFVTKEGENMQPIPHADDYYQKMERVLSAIHRLSSAALGLKELDFFEAFYDKSLPTNSTRGNNGNALRLAYYPALSELGDESNASYSLSATEDSAARGTCKRAESTAEYDWSIRYGAHTDYQGYTILRPDKSDWHTVTVEYQQDGERKTLRERCGGLQVYHPTQQKWIPVQVPMHVDGLVVNAGDLIQRWTNDRWHSPLHRVVCSSATSSQLHQPGLSNTVPPTVADFVSRQAIVFFTGPIEDHVIEVLECCRSGDDEAVQRKYPPIRSGDHLLMKLNRTNLTVNDDFEIIA